MDPIEPSPSIMAAIQDRRTIKQFRSDPVPEETLWRILDAVRWAPNHRLTEPWRIAVLGTQSREALADALAGQTASNQDPSVVANAKEEARQKIMSSPVLLAITCRLTGNPAQQVEDLAAVCAAVQNLQLAAWVRGLELIGIPGESPGYQKPALCCNYQSEANNLLGSFISVIQRKFPIRRNGGRSRIS